MQNEISGMLLFDKPEGITSFKAVSKIRKALNIKKAGHCGTLDPAATGLLLILAGKATKLQDKFMKKDKEYLCSFLLGIVTDSGDLDGKIIKETEVGRHIGDKQIKEALNAFTGEIEQIPPMFSALKHKGKKLYELARQGLTVERKPRKISIKNIEFISFKNNIIEARVFCSSGTYIRTLAQDIGDFLGCGATVKSLRREKIGDFCVEDALTDKDLGDFDKIKKGLISIESLTGNNDEK